MDSLKPVYPPVTSSAGYNHTGGSVEFAGAFSTDIAFRNPWVAVRHCFPRLQKQIISPRGATSLSVSSNNKNTTLGEQTISVAMDSKQNKV